MKFLPILLLSLAGVHAWAQQSFFESELLGLADFSRLPRYRTGEMHQLSSYDRTGGNDDGFSGKYSFVREEPGGRVIADLKGPGVVNRIWTPTPTADTIKFYFDGEATPRIALPFIDLFTGKQFPFMSPLCGNEIGGYYCYVPIPYKQSLKIVFAGKNLRFHQTQYRALAKNENVESFSREMFRRHLDTFEHVGAVWTKRHWPLATYGNRLKVKKINMTLRPGSEQSIFDLNGGGRILGIELNGAGFDQVYQKLMLTARWDDENRNAIDLPLHNFFGYAFGKPSMQSILLGADGQNFYSYLPMPFDKSAQIKLQYLDGDSGPDEIVVSGNIYYSEDRRDSKTEGKLYVQSRRQYNIPSGTPHTIADIKGRGHYVGTILITQGLQEGSTWYFEGDDRATIDGELRLHGTGSEDYFNGGWYAVMDRWDRGMSLPIHGSLDYDLMTSRTGGYRFYLTDKLNFDKSFNLTIEHQPDANNNVKTDYTSLGFFYADPPQYENTSIVIDEEVKKISYRDKLTAQGMKFSLYWNANASYEDPAMVFSMKASNEWFATIDPEAVPVAQIFLSNLDNGKYKLTVEYETNDVSGQFSIWQRSRQISEWLDATTAAPGKTKVVGAGEIEITDDVKTITIRKKSGDTTVKIHALLFERIK